MTNRTSVNDRRKFDTDEGAADELAPGSGKRLLIVARLVVDQLRRTVVFAPIFGVVYLALGFLWFQGVQTEGNLNAVSESQLALLAQPVPRPELLLRQTEGWNTAYGVILDRRISRPTDSNLIGRVIGAAEAAGLVVIETGTDGDGIVTLGNDRYTATPMLIKANGTLDGIERFLSALETDEFSAFEVQASTSTAGTVGYVLTLRGVFYSLPENYGDVLAGVDDDTLVIPIGPAGVAGAGRVAP